MNFVKTFLAGLLAVVVGSVVVFVLWLVILLGVAGSMGSTTTLVESDSILKIDLSEMITDAPVADPFA
ncbi:MAG: signal peptide peptidase SppA, partial [Alistipes sp.]|nr:signal peptide peptidase SppA [Alistipes sp.]